MPVRDRHQLPRHPSIIRLYELEPGERILPEPFNIRSAVHEYGGGAWALDPDSEVNQKSGCDTEAGVVVSVQKEEEGSLGDSLQLYRKAYRVRLIG